MRLRLTLGPAQRIVLIVGVAAVLAALGRYLETVGRHDLAFGWFAYAPLNTTLPRPGGARAPWVQLVIWAGVSAVWAVASLRIVGSALGRRIVLVVGLAGVLIALGNYLSTLGGRPNEPGLQYLSSEQLSELGSRLAPWAQLLVWAGLAVIWTASACFLLPRTGSRGSRR